MRQTKNPATMMLFVLLALVLAACGGNGKDDTPVTPGDTDQEADLDRSDADSESAEGDSDAAERDAESAEPDPDVTDGESANQENDTDSEAVTEACVVGGLKRLSLDDACNADSDCESNLCHFFVFGTSTLAGVCTKPCGTSASDTCPATMTCESEDGTSLCRPLTTGGEPQIGPGDASLGRYAPCWQNADCQSGACLAFGSTTPTAFCTVDCTSDASRCGDCGSCLNGTDDTKICIPNGTGAVGAICSYELDCASHFCFTYGEATPYCTDYCSTSKAAPCPDGFICRAVNESDSLCLRPADTDSAFGASCQYGFQCASARCVGLARETAYCSQSCTLTSGKAQGSCPEDYACVDYQGFGQFVCIKDADTQAAFGAKCSQNWQCATGICYEGTCNQTCAIASDLPGRKADTCPTGTACVLIDGDLRCVDGSVIGTTAQDEACAHDYECTNGLYCKSYEVDSVDTRLTLFGGDAATTLASGDNSASGFEKLTYTFAMAGTYYLKVSLGAGAGGKYALRVTPAASSTDTLVPASETEPNNEAATANAFEVPFLVFASLASEDDDWFKIVVAANNTTYVFATDYREPPLRCEALPSCAAAQTIVSLPFETSGVLSGDSAFSLSGCAGYDVSGPDSLYALSLSAGDRVYIRATTTAQADLSLFVTMNCVRCVSFEDFSANGGFENLVFTAPVSGSYRLLVDSRDPVEGGIPYTLTVSDTVPAATCEASFPTARCCLSDTQLGSCDSFGYLHSITCSEQCGFFEGDPSDPTSDPGYFCVSSDDPAADPTGALPRACPNVR